MLSCLTTRASKLVAGMLLLSSDYSFANAGETGDLSDEMLKGLYSSFSTPFEQLINGTAQEGLTLRLAIDLPLKSKAVTGTGFQTQGERPSSPTMQLGIKYVPLSSWFASVNFSRYLSPSNQEAWNPDFTYAFGYDDWHPYTFSLAYSNNGGNRLNPNKTRNEKITEFNEGTWALGYKFPFPYFLNDWFLFSDNDNVGCNTSYNYSRTYTDLKAAGKLNNKKVINLGCKYAFSNNWYFNVTSYFYIKKDYQQPWDPDFTYGFGYFDWHPGSYSVQYNNYSGNRYPWREKSPGTGRFKDGSITISWSTNII